jgi:DtxR family Mn-dependent transcriptional regulator
MLGYDLADVHAEADRLEHVISEEFEDRVSRALGDPERGPHGDPIPARDPEAPEVGLSTPAEQDPPTRIRP